MFHSDNNTFWGRLPDGSVRIVKFSGPPHVMWHHGDDAVTRPTEFPRADGEFRTVEVLFDLRIDPNIWASIVASVSAGGEENGRFFEARTFHQGT